MTDLPGLIVSTAWLAEHLGDPSVRVFDCTVRVDPTPDSLRFPSGRPLYDAGHIPGAAFADLTTGLNLHDEGANWFTLGLGQNAVFAFDFTSINLGGLSGNYTLSGAELNRIAYQFTGAIIGNVEIIVPKTTQQYWVYNNTTGGSFTLRVRTSTQSPGVLVTRGSRAILYCDGANVVDAETGGIATPVAIADGGTGATTAGAALINLGGTTVGIAVFTAVDQAAAQSAIGVTSGGGDTAAIVFAVALG